MCGYPVESMVSNHGTVHTYQVGCTFKAKFKIVTTAIMVGEEFSVRPTGAYCYFPMLRFHSASFYGCLGLTPVSMTSASAQLTQLGGNYANLLTANTRLQT